jgi:thioredoxin reductase (NADPH)
VEQTVAAVGSFVFIPARLLTNWMPPETVRNRHGFLFAGNDLGDAWPLERRPFPLEMCIPRLLAAGDVRHGSIKRVAAAVGEGATASSSSTAWPVRNNSLSSELVSP